MIKLLKRLFKALLGIGEDAVSSIEDVEIKNRQLIGDYKEQVFQARKAGAELTTYKIELEKNLEKMKRDLDKAIANAKAASISGNQNAAYAYAEDVEAIRDTITSLESQISNVTERCNDIDDKIEGLMKKLKECEGMAKETVAIARVNDATKKANDAVGSSTSSAYEQMKAMNEKAKHDSTVSSVLEGQGVNKDKIAFEESQRLVRLKQTLEDINK